MDKFLLAKSLEVFGLPHSDFVLENFEKISQNTIKTNELFNLTAIKDIDVFREKMVLDSALGILHLDLDNKKVIDVGTGAGFPGLVLYVLNPKMHLTLLDATKKKIDYLRDFALINNYQLDCVNDRIEDYSIKHTEEYDYAFARAVAPINILVEIISPLLKIGGTLVLLKGPNAEEEIKEAKTALNILGLSISDVFEYQLPESKEVRKIIHIKKIKATPNKFPRSYSAIKKKPL